MSLKGPSFSFTHTQHELVVIKKVALKRHLGAFQSGGFAWWSFFSQIIAGVGLLGTALTASKAPFSGLGLDIYRFILFVLAAVFWIFAGLYFLKIFGPYGSVKRALERISEEQEGIMTTRPVRPQNIGSVRE